MYRCVHIQLSSLCSTRAAPYDCRDNAFLASSPAFLALVTEGRTTPATVPPNSAIPDIDPFVFRADAFAAATARSRFPLLCLFPMLPDRAAARSPRLRKGLGRFSSSNRSYSAGIDAVAGAEFVRCMARVEDPGVAVRAFGSEGTELLWLWRCG